MKSIAVVTGAGTGIGRAIALRLAEERCHVVVASHDVTKGDDVATEITASGGTATVVAVDVMDRVAVDALASRTAALGGATVVVNNAGWDRIEPFLDNTETTWTRIVETNLLGTVRVVQAFLPQLMEHKGVIVNITSEAGRIGSAAGRAAEAVYAGAKAGVVGFTKSIARELARHGVRANCVSPGATDSGLFHSQPPAIREAIIKSTPIRRMAHPDEIAAAVAFMAGEQSSFITGQVLSVSGGMTMVD